MPADRFFEWRHIQKKNDPKYEISIPGRSPFALAGIWSMWKNKTRVTLPTVSVITSDPNESMAELHDRQPVILVPRDYNKWMKPSERPPLHLLRITTKEEMKLELVDAHSMQLPLNRM